MSEEINQVHIKTYDEWLKYYKNATKEQVIEDLTRDVQYFADAVKDIKDLQQKVEQLENIRKECVDYIEKDKLNIDESQCYVETQTRWKMIPEIYDDLLNILNKGSESNVKD